MSNHNEPYTPESDDAWAPGSPIELDVPPWPQNGDLDVISSWHPKLTGARLFVIFTTIGLGTAKAATSYRGDTIAPVTIEWVMTIVLFILFLVLNNLESKEDARPKWFFKFDTLDLVWRLLRRLSFRSPRYQTDEIDTNLLLKPKYPPITGYRILAGLSFKGKSTEPTTIEFYYLGLYEASTTRVLPLLFEEDYSKQVLYTTQAIFLLLAHGLSLFLTCGWAYLWGSGIHDMWFGEPQPDLPPTTPIEAFLTKVMMMFWTLGASVATSIGAGASLFLLYSMGVIIAPGAKKIYTFTSTHLRSWASSESVDDEEQAGLVEWFNDHLLTSAVVIEPPLWLKWAGMLLLGVAAAAGYVIVHALAFLFAGGWTGGWVFGLYELWKGIGEMPWYMLGLQWFGLLLLVSLLQ
ncbi:hypothetical protein BKA70DRAFT_1489507 [Coprinopsis sp. MPI-PUGE-AT-0042]|nr:hypothetical protein BKA70DRAFT_1489507 [Coprinopsis sp. MPI-PUGE-AT-0042]